MRLEQNVGRAVALAAAGALLGTQVASAQVRVPRFVDETDSAGLTHVNTYKATPESPDGGWEFVVGGGVAVLDCDVDGMPDLYLAGGSSPSGLYRNEGDVGGPLRFSRLADPATDLVHVTGAYPIDIDGDRHTDLAVLRLGENVLLRGLGDCRFERANEDLGLEGGSDWTTAFSAAWEAGAQLPTLAFGNYQAVDEAGALTQGCADNVLFRPGPGATTYDPPTSLSPGWCTLSILFSDWDRSGRRDLRVSNDREFYQREGQEQLWRMSSDEPPTAYTEEDGWERTMIYGMGIASHDLDRRWLPGGLPDEHVRQPAGDAGGGPGPSDLQERRREARGGIRLPGRWQRQAPLDLLAPGVPGRQQRRPRGPVRVEGQPGRHARPRQRAIPAASCSGLPAGASWIARSQPVSWTSPVRAARPSST